jgi:hypothetical protein
MKDRRDSRAGLASMRLALSRYCSSTSRISVRGNVLARRFFVSPGSSTSQPASKSTCRYSLLNSSCARQPVRYAASDPRKCSGSSSRSFLRSSSSTKALPHIVFVKKGNGRFTRQFHGTHCHNGRWKDEKAGGVRSNCHNFALKLPVKAAALSNPHDRLPCRGRSRHHATLSACDAAAVLLGVDSLLRA